jgi:hypothetical protein
MRDDDLDRILNREEILPSSGFVDSVMDAVRREAATPPPIPFPWKRALPGLFVAVLVLVSVLVSGAARLTSPVPTPRLPGTPAFALPSLLNAARFVGVDWIVLVLLLTLTSVVFSMRLTGAQSMRKP